MTDLEKAGQTISATITGRKAFVEEYVEEPKAEEKGDTAGTTTDTKTPEKASDGGDSVANQKANEQPAPSGSVAPISNKKTEKASGNQTLPNTGQEALGSLLISLGGLVSLGMAVSMRRKEGE